MVLLVNFSSHPQQGVDSFIGGGLSQLHVDGRPSAVWKLQYRIHFQPGLGITPAPQLSAEQLGIHAKIPENKGFKVQPRCREIACESISPNYQRCCSRRRGNNMMYWSAA